MLYHTDVVKHESCTVVYRSTESFVLTTAFQDAALRMCFAPAAARCANQGHPAVRSVSKLLVAIVDVE